MPAGGRVLQDVTNLRPPDRAAVIPPFLLCALNPLPAQITRERRLLAVEPYRPW